MVRVGKKVWKVEEELKLSMLLVTFWQRHGCLPHVRAYGFWKTVKDRLQRFSIKQIQRKVLSLRKRHLQILNGNAREVKPNEAETLPIWLKMIGSGGDTEDEEDDVARAVGGSGVAGEDAVNEHKEAAHCEGTDGVQADADQGQASRHQGLWRDGPGGVNAGYGTDNAGIGGEGGARGSTEGAESSCCILEEPDEPEEVEEVEEEEEVEEMPAGEGREQEEQAGWGAAAEGGATQDNHHAFWREGASPSNPKQELQMLTCITMSDLATAVRTLAEVIARSQPVPV